MEIKSSVFLAALLSLFHGLAAVVVYVTDMPMAAKLTLLPVIVLSLTYYLIRDVMRLLPYSWRNISLDENGMVISMRDGSSLTGAVMGDTFVSPYFIVLRVALQEHSLASSRVIFPDALSTDKFRELCVRLRHA
jgi:toxin CptA